MIYNISKHYLNCDKVLPNYIKLQWQQIWRTNNGRKVTHNWVVGTPFDTPAAALKDKLSHSSSVQYMHESYYKSQELLTTHTGEPLHSACRASRVISKQYASFSRPISSIISLTCRDADTVTSKNICNKKLRKIKSYCKHMQGPHIQLFRWTQNYI